MNASQILQLSELNTLDWTEIEHRFAWLRDGLDPIALPTEAELRRYKADASRGRLMRNGLALALDWGERSFPGSPRRKDRIKQFNGDLQCGGAVELFSCFEV